MSNLPLQKTGLQKYKTKNTLVYSGSTTSVSDDMSKHSDSSIIDIPENDDTDSDDIPLYCLKRSRLLCSSNNDNEPALNYKDDQISVDMLCDSNCNHDIVSSTVSRRESMSSTNSKISSFPPICKSIIPGTSYAQARCSPTEYLIFNGDTMLSDKIPSPSSENEQTSLNYSVNDTVLVRYYTKNKWKYYIGVISTCNNDDTFDISFYVTTRSKGQLKFKRPKKIDRDTVPKISIEKIITIDKISDKPEEYKLQNQADALYF
ncbi:unnamed protein product [Diatraea saccharalis]|uniref:Uncharacterized protein n=1 Tax=Diatraea saccharalis TaxID=40085 RepID=A0A9N9WG44_9NEOP|nr:unnamed protein product [Diatraea saccharalis]